MANDLRESNAAVNGKADYISDQLDNGYLRIYDGSRPATADTAVGAQVLLAELRFNATVAGAAVAGVLTFNALTADASANATGTASWFRALSSDGTTAQFDGEVGTSGSDLNLNTTSIVSGAEVSISAFTYTQPK
jgi:hypothetical protein